MGNEEQIGRKGKGEQIERKEEEMVNVQRLMVNWEQRIGWWVMGNGEQIERKEEEMVNVQRLMVNWEQRIGDGQVSIGER